jgi:hypothetical protein
MRFKPLLLTCFMMAAFIVAAESAAQADLSGSTHRTSLLPEGKLHLASIGGIWGDGSAPVQEAQEPELKPKSYAIAVPLALIIGFGSGHFYAGATWRGFRYLAYDLIAIALDAVMMVLVYKYADPNTVVYYWILAGAIFGGERIYQMVDCIKTVADYNKGFDIRDAIRAPRSPSDLASNPNDGGMPSMHMRTIYTF